MTKCPDEMICMNTRCWTAHLHQIPPTSIHFQDHIRTPLHYLQPKSSIRDTHSDRLIYPIRPLNLPFVMVKLVSTAYAQPLALNWTYQSQPGFQLYFYHQFGWSSTSYIVGYRTVLNQKVRKPILDSHPPVPCNTCFSKAPFTTRTDLSAAPFVAGWYGGTKVCLIPFSLMNLANSSDVNCAPLSETSCSGRPCSANMSLSSAMVRSVVVDVISLASIHFEWLSMNTRK